MLPVIPELWGGRLLGNQPTATAEVSETHSADITTTEIIKNCPESMFPTLLQAHP